MATKEKKKRIPKPKKTAAIEAVRLALSFLNHKGKHGVIPQELFELSLDAFHCFYPNLDGNDKSYWLNWSETEPAAFHLSETWRNCSEILANLMSGKIEYLDHTWIDESFENIKTMLGYKLALEHVARPNDGDTSKGNLQGFRASLVRALIEAFRDSGNTYFGKCKKCGIIFFKKQANAEYCSKYCMDKVFRTVKKK